MKPSLETTKQTVKTTRPRRANINGTRNVLTVSGKDPDYEYRIVNDSGDRLSQFQEMGYEVVSDRNVKVGDRRIANPTQEGSPIKVSVGKGDQAYVMRIKKEWFEEDKVRKAAHVDEMEKGTLREAKQTADFGKLSIS